MTVARGHHFLPKAYLDGFTDANGVLFVYDGTSGRGWPSSPEKTAKERDFYRVDTPGIPLDALETEISKIEGPALDAIRRIERDMVYPTPAELVAILSFIALQGTRGPDHRRRIDGMHGQAREQLEPLLREMYRKHVADTPVGAVQDEDTWLRTQLGALADRDTYLRSMIAGQPTILDALLKMNSQFALLPASGPDLVCSDAPYKCIVADGTGYRWAGVYEAASVVMPLSKRLLWQAQWDDKPRAFIPVTLPEHAKLFAAHGNGYTVTGAHFTYSASAGPPHGCFRHSSAVPP